MRSQGATLSMIQARFQGRERSIARAFAENGSFRDLCDDYRKCASAVDRWQRQKGKSAVSRRREYQELLEELALEIRTWLDAMESVSTQENEREH